MKIIRLGKVKDTTGLGGSTIYRYVAAGRFPKPVSLGGGSIGWIEEEVLKWVSARVAERDAA
jgi:prophage regulatory protein